jgi:hypothetical protein
LSWNNSSSVDLQLTDCCVTEVGGGTITADNIKAGTITANEIESGTITTNELETGTLSASNIEAGTLSAAVTASAYVTVGSSGAIRSSGKTFNSNTRGFFLGYDGVSNYDLEIGERDGKYLAWDGSAGSLDIGGQIVATGNVNNSAITTVQVGYSSGGVAVTSDGLDNTGSSMSVSDADMTTLASSGNITPTITPANGGRILLQCNVSLSSYVGMTVTSAQTWAYTFWLARYQSSTWTGILAWPGTMVVPGEIWSSTRYHRNRCLLSFQYVDTGFSTGSAANYALRCGISTSSTSDKAYFSRRSFLAIHTKR